VTIVATNESELAAATDRLTRLETVQAAQEAVYRYVEGLDARDWDLVASALAPQVVLVAPDGDVSGADAVLESLQAALGAGFTPCHQVTNARVEVTGPGRAVVTSKVRYALVGDEAGSDAVGWGTYRDEIEVTDGVGRIVRKDFAPAQHLVGSVASLAERLEALETTEAARAATWRYATAVDTVDFDLLAQCFAEDAVLTTRRGPRNGRTEVLDYYRASLTDPVARKHLLCNQKVTVTGPGEAEVDSYFAYTYAGDDTSIIGWGRYVDTVRVVDGVGLLTSKRISIDVHADSRVGWATDGATS
jgi:ketosteroid isomerase-like protein